MRLPSFPKTVAHMLLGVENPTYLKGPGDHGFVTVGFLGITAGISVILVGLVSMIFGKNKVQR